MIFSCCDNRRLAVLADQSVYNGIDFLDVVDEQSQALADRQRTLRVHFVHALVPGQLDESNVKISGGERITGIHVLQAFDEVLSSPSGDPNVLVVVVDAAGDFSTYTLTLVDSANSSHPPASFDRVLSTIDFSFKAACPSPFDCAAPTICPSIATEKIDISYLAKDYASFRALMLDRLAKIIPQWQERNPADLGIVLVEILAYIGDYLSYLQDAVATEVYLDTARRRTSIRRLARLVDYPLNDGRNARSWMHLDIRADIHGLALAKNSLQFLTRTNTPSVILPKDSDSYKSALNEAPRVFEQMEPIALYAEHNSIPFYTWGDRGCCLPIGATYAWLRGSYPNLVAGNVLIFEEVKGPQTGAREDADSRHRAAVRLTAVDATFIDPLGGQFDDPPTANPVAVTRIQWGTEDALTFPVCVSSVTINGDFEDVSLVLGNNVLADEGRTIKNESLPPVPGPNPALTIPNAPGSDRCHRGQATLKPARYRPSLAQGPLTFADPFTYKPSASAQSALSNRTFDSLLPQATLAVPSSKDVWQPQRDLLHSHKEATEFVAEVENDGTAFLRFGDDTFGMRPPKDTQFVATYRIGQGVAGNIGCDSFRHVASSDGSLLDPVIVSVRNPLPAAGGADPESIESVRQAAPYAFRVQERAVTADDYGLMAVRCNDSLQRALGTFRWTGSWQTVFVSVDPKGSEALEEKTKEDVQQCMEAYRMAGHDVEVDAAIYVSLEIEIDVCVKPGYFAADVESELLDALSNRNLPDGTRGVFYPDNFTFGQTVYLSPIYARIQATPGVDSVVISKFQRQGKDSDEALKAGKMLLHRQEIARLDNDPNFPEHGTLNFTFTGGQ
jgi:hypothetical protein